jgi:hypothetical protein
MHLGEAHNVKSEKFGHGAFEDQIYRKLSQRVKPAKSNGVMEAAQ